jgi:hypothetical protein
MFVRWTSQARSAAVDLFKLVRKAPPRQIPVELLNSYTLNGKIPVKEWYLNNTYPSFIPRIYRKGEFSSYIDFAKRKEEFYYRSTSRWIYAALEKYSIKEKDVAVMGSVRPMCEAICWLYGGRPVTIEYNKIISLDPRLRAMTVEEFERRPRVFDTAFSISSFEHDGLGRYGDPLNPEGDLRAMEHMKSVVRPGGWLFLAVPVGKDTLVWNAHRVYGRIRLPLLLKGWKVLDIFGLEESSYDRPPEKYVQPIFVLKNE